MDFLSSQYTRVPSSWAKPMAARGSSISSFLSFFSICVDLFLWLKWSSHRLTPQRLTNSSEPHSKVPQWSLIFFDSFPHWIGFLLQIRLDLPHTVPHTLGKASPKRCDIVISSSCLGYYKQLFSLIVHWTYIEASRKLSPGLVVCTSHILKESSGYKCSLI